MTNTTKQHQTRSVATRGERNTMVEVLSGETDSGLATADDLRVISQAEVPPGMAKNPPRDIASSLTAESWRRPR